MLERPKLLSLVLLSDSLDLCLFFLLLWVVHLLELITHSFPSALSDETLSYAWSLGFRGRRLS